MGQEKSSQRISCDLKIAAKDRTRKSSQRMSCDLKIAIESKIRRVQHSS